MADLRTRQRFIGCSGFSVTEGYLRNIDATIATFGVVLIIEGIEIITAGWSVERRGADFEVASPHHRTAGGRWNASLELPAELFDAIGAEVMAVMGVAVAVTA